MKAAKVTEVPGAASFGGFPGVWTIDGRMLYQDQSLASMNGSLGPAPFFEPPTGVKPAFMGKGFIYGLQRVR